jgi:hypothetical protein
MNECVISLKLSHALAEQIDARTSDRTEFLRQATEEKLARARKHCRGTLAEAIRAGNSVGLPIAPAAGLVQEVRL